MKLSISRSAQRTAPPPMRIGFGNRNSAISAYAAERERAVADLSVLGARRHGQHMRAAEQDVAAAVETVRASRSAAPAVQLAFGRRRPSGTGRSPP